VEEIPEITLFGGGRLSITYDGPFPHAAEPARIYVTEVTFPEPLRKEDRFRFALLKRHSVEFDEIVREGWQDSFGLTALQTPTETATLSVRFPEKKLPRRVWHYEDIPDWLLPGVSTEANELEVSEEGFATFTWTKLFVGFCYGLAWDW